MASNPLIPQGTLNKLLVNVSVVDNPDLNVSSSFLAPEGVMLTLEGEASAYLPTLTGAVPSPNPYQIATLAIHLNRAQGLAWSWKGQMEQSALIGDVTLTTDSPVGDTYYLSNCTIKSGPSELAMSGGSVDFTVVLQGTYYINSQLWEQAAASAI